MNSWTKTTLRMRYLLSIMTGRFKEEVWIEIVMCKCATSQCEWELQAYSQAIN